MNVHPCTGCIACGYDGPCVQKDDMQELRKAVMESYMLDFATPLYFFGISAQRKKPRCLFLARFSVLSASGCF